MSVKEVVTGLESIATSPPQFPCAAMTIHNCQRNTLEEVAERSLHLDEDKTHLIISWGIVLCSLKEKNATTENEPRSICPER